MEVCVDCIESGKQTWNIKSILEALLLSVHWLLFRWDSFSINELLPRQLCCFGSAIELTFGAPGDASTLSATVKVRKMVGPWENADVARQECWNSLHTPVPHSLVPVIKHLHSTCCPNCSLLKAETSFNRICYKSVIIRITDLFPPCQLKHSSGSSKQNIVEGDGYPFNNIRPPPLNLATLKNFWTPLIAFHRTLGQFFTLT